MVKPILVIASMYLSIAPIIAQTQYQPRPKLSPLAATTQTIEHTAKAITQCTMFDNVYSYLVHYVFEPKDVGYSGGKQWSLEWRKHLPLLYLEVEKVVVTHVTSATAIVKVTYHWKHTKPSFRSQSITEGLLMRQGKPLRQGSTLLAGSPMWQAAALDPASPKDAKIIGGPPVRRDARGRVIPPENALVLNELIRAVVDPKVAWANVRDKAVLLSLLHLALAMESYLDENNNRIAARPDSIQKALQPYLDPSDSDRLLNPFSGKPFTFNRGLTGLTIMPEEIDKTANIVLFYEGENQQPVFSYDGKAAIGFLDGHVKMITPEDMKMLVWNPHTPKLFP